MHHVFSFQTRGLSLILPALVVSATGCSTIVWEPGLQAGLQKAARTGKPALVQFHAMFDSECMEMDADVFSDPDVEETMRDYVPIRLDYGWKRDLADRLGVEVLPTFFIFRADGSLAGSHAGKMNAVNFRTFLMKYRYY